MLYFVIKAALSGLIVAAVSEIARRSPGWGGLLASLRTFAQSGVASAGAGAGTMALAEVIAHWPL